MSVVLLPVAGDVVHHANPSSCPSSYLSSTGTSSGGLFCRCFDSPSSLPRSARNLGVSSSNVSSAPIADVCVPMAVVWLPGWLATFWLSG